MIVNFEDICLIDSLFEKMMISAQKAKTKEEVIMIIQEKHLLIKEKKLCNALDIFLDDWSSNSELMSFRFIDF